MNCLRNMVFLQDRWSLCSLAHEALGNVEQGAVRFSFSHYNTDEEIETAIRAIEELAQDEE